MSLWWPRSAGIWYEKHENRADHWLISQRETLDDLIGRWSVEDKLALTTPNKVLATCMSKEWINTYGIFGKTLIKELEV